MNPPLLDEMQSRLSRLERQNRILIALLCALAGLGSIAATNHADSVISAGEIRTSHFTLIDNHGNTIYEMKGVDGAFIPTWFGKH
jgi:hypothetical protein